MTPSEYRKVRESLKLTQGQLADLLGVALNTVSRRELGQIAIEREAELALQWVVSTHKKSSTKSLKRA